jgi:hypothetical protein
MDGEAAEPAEGSLLRRGLIDPTLHPCLLYPVALAGLRVLPPGVGRGPHAPRSASARQ